MYPYTMESEVYEVLVYEVFTHSQFSYKKDHNIKYTRKACQNN